MLTVPPYPRRSPGSKFGPSFGAPKAERWGSRCYTRSMAERVAASRLATPRKATPTTGAGPRAGLGTRALSFLLDSLVLFAFTMLFATASFLDIFFRSDSGKAKGRINTPWTTHL